MARADVNGLSTVMLLLFLSLSLPPCLCLCFVALQSSSSVSLISFCCCCMLQATHSLSRLKSYRSFKLQLAWFHSACYQYSALDMWQYCILFIMQIRLFVIGLTMLYIVMAKRRTICKSTNTVPAVCVSY